MDEILTVPGMDIALVGLGDLNVSLGVEGMTDPKLDDAIDRVVNICRRHNVPSGIQIGDMDALIHCARAGMQLLDLGTDVSF